MNAFLQRELMRLWPAAAWLSEESADTIARLEASRVIIVDPIDGTRGFARGDPHWAVAIALAVSGRPAVAIVHAPALGETYLARAGGGARLNGRPLVVAPADSLQPEMEITCPQGVAKALRDVGVEFAYQPKIASLALRIAKVASGVYQVGVASGHSHDWDIAASDLVLQEAGGLLADLDGAPIVYNKPDPSHGVLVAAARSLQPLVREALSRTSYGRRSG